MIIIPQSLSFRLRIFDETTETVAIVVVEEEGKSLQGNASTEVTREIL